MKTELSQLRIGQKSWKQPYCLSQELQQVSDAYSNRVKQIVQYFKEDKVGAIMLMLSAESFVRYGSFEDTCPSSWLDWMVSEGGVEWIGHGDDGETMLDLQLKVRFTCIVQKLCRRLVASSQLNLELC